MRPKPSEPHYYEHVSYHDSKTVELYHELVGRHDHLLQALSLYERLQKLRTDDIKKFDDFMRLREALLWFLTVEFYSRFLSDPSSRNGSKRCLKKLVNKISDTSITSAYDKFLQDESEVIGFIKKQRNEYFAHADDVEWDGFPRVFNDEYHRILSETADILDVIRVIIGTQRICRRDTAGEQIFLP